MADGGVGHNSGAVNADKLKSYVERLERLAEERAGLAADMKDVLDSAASDGFDKRTIREIIRLRKLSKEELEERQELLDLYSHALGVFG